jgi:hypothetical protein
MDFELIVIVLSIGIAVGMFIAIQMMCRMIIRMLAIMVLATKQPPSESYCPGESERSLLDDEIQEITQTFP